MNGSGDEDLGDDHDLSMSKDGDESLVKEEPTTKKRKPNDPGNNSNSHLLS